MEENKKTEWKRPQDVEVFRTSDPKQMLGKYMPKHAVKEWDELFVDEVTGGQISIKRSQIVVERGYIDLEKLSQIQFAIQSGEIEDVEVSEENIQNMTLYTPAFGTNFMVEIPVSLEKYHIAVKAQTIPQAIQIVAEFGQMYLSIGGMIRATRVVPLDAAIVPDDHACIPEEDRNPAYERKAYYKVQVRHEWIEDLKLKKSDQHYIVVANDVSQAKERIALLLDIRKAEREKQEGFKQEDNDARITIRKAAPFEVDYIVPEEFSDLYLEEPTQW